jgi:hypothetical protein
MGDDDGRRRQIAHLVRLRVYRHLKVSKQPKDRLYEAK